VLAWLTPENQRFLAESRAEVDSWTPQVCLETAEFARQIRPAMGTARRSELLEEIARDLEERAAAKLAAGHPR
jgi:hypothetical protein